MVSFSSQACVASDKLDVYYISEFCRVIATTPLQMFSSRLFFMQGFLTYTLSFNVPHKWKLHSWDLTNETTVHCLLLFDLKHSANSAQNCLLCDLLHCLSVKWYRLSHNQTSVQNMVNLSLWVYDIKKNGLRYLATLVARHTSHLTLCDCSMFILRRCSSREMKLSSITKVECGGFCFSRMHLMI
jgi:hypothetical protein